jgi:hypothetical protein
MNADRAHGVNIRAARQEKESPTVMATVRANGKKELLYIFAKGKTESGEKDRSRRGGSTSHRPLRIRVDVGKYTRYLLKLVRQPMITKIERRA